MFARFDSFDSFDSLAEGELLHFLFWPFGLEVLILASCKFVGEVKFPVAEGFS